ncbi:unnamed protein product, partial [Meganyctiphanes norvegica]
MNHVISHSSEKTFTCKKCDYKTISNSSLSRHYREQGHGNNYKCMECDSEFRFMNALIKNANEIHRNLEPLSCLICQKLYSNKFSLNRHMKIHTTVDIAINENNSNTEHEVLTGFLTENDQSDQNNNIEPIISKNQISNETVDHLENIEFKFLP